MASLAMKPETKLKVFGGVNISCLIALLAGISKLSRRTRARLLFAAGHPEESYAVSAKGGMQVTKFIFESLGPREYSVAGLFAFMLFVRTWCDLRMIRLMTNVETNLVGRRRNASMKALLDFAVFMLPVSMVNAALSYTQDELKIAIRNSLTRRLLDKFMAANTFYHVANPSPEDMVLAATIAHPDHVMSHDVEEFSKMVAKP